jgi:hypothetical protein
MTTAPTLLRRYVTLVEAAAMSAHFYHGTCSGFAESIQHHGLRAADSKPKGGASRRGVYLTDDYLTATDYGSLICDLKHHGEHDIVVFAVDGGALDQRLLQPDDYDLQDALQGGEIVGSEPIDPRLQKYRRWDEVPWQVSLAITHQVFYAGSIPANALRMVAP